MYYPDLAPCDYLGRFEAVVAVGWLEPVSVSSGSCFERIRERLVRCLAPLGHAWSTLEAMLRILPAPRVSAAP